MCLTRTGTRSLSIRILTKIPQLSSWGIVGLLTASTRFYKEVNYFRIKSKTIFVTPRRWFKTFLLRCTKWSDYNPVFSVAGAPNLDISSSMCSRDSRRMSMSVNVWMVSGFSVLAANARASRRLVAAAFRESLTGVVNAIRWEQVWGKGVYLVYSFS